MAEGVYLDTNVCRRPLDDQRVRRVRRESRAFLEIADKALKGETEVASSDYVKFEIEQIQEERCEEFLENVKHDECPRQRTTHCPGQRGEVSKRCKHEWIHWSTQGLRNILTTLPVRCTEEPLYNKLKKAYIHNRPFTETGTAQKVNI